jgi:NAD(P)-dependent dehydrogenase (short-subunit alcohol dehydrogenase family)
MNSTLILKGKHAVVFGAGGSIGAAVGKEFASEGAEVFLAGRTKTTVEAVAKEIAATGGRSHAVAIDSTDDAAVNQFIDNIVKQTGKIDIVIDLAGPLAKDYGNGKKAVDLPVEEFMIPLTNDGQGALYHRPCGSAAHDQSALRSDHSRDWQPGPAARAGRYRYRRSVWRNGKPRREPCVRGQPVRR